MQCFHFSLWTAISGCWKWGWKLKMITRWFVIPIYLLFHLVCSGFIYFPHFFKIISNLNQAGFSYISIRDFLFLCGSNFCSPCVVTNLGITGLDTPEFLTSKWCRPFFASKDWYQISDPLMKGISPWILGTKWGGWIRWMVWKHLVWFKSVVLFCWEMDSDSAKQADL